MTSQLAGAFAKKRVMLLVSKFDHDLSLSLADPRTAYAAVLNQ